MNQETLLIILPGLVLIFLGIGLYLSIFQKKDEAQEHIQTLLADKKKIAVRGRDSGDLLKKRRKNKGSESFMDRLETDMERANLLLTPLEFVGIAVGFGVVVALIAIFAMAMNPIVGVLIGIAAIFCAKLFLVIKIKMRMGKAARELADVLDFMVNGFKTGYGFGKAVQSVADNFPDPWGTEFGKLSAEMNLGLTQEEALLNFSNRMPMPDVDLFVTAILIQKDTGGNMSELLATLSKTCRDRYKLFQKVGAISAQGKLSAGIICCVPFGLSGMMFLFMPGPTTKFVTNPIGIVVLILAGIWMSIGIGVLYKIVQIEV